jgi:hypothetical protein
MKRLTLTGLLMEGAGSIASQPRVSPFLLSTAVPLTVCHPSGTGCWSSVH